MTPRLILASTSPRRRELLGYLGVPFEVIGSDFDEDSIATAGLTPAEWVMQLAQGKAQTVAAQLGSPLTPSPSPQTGEEEAVAPASSSPQTWGGGGASYLVIGADTTVILDGEYLNKPTDADDAKRMLRRLSGRTHQVYTGLCLIEVKDGQLQSPLTDYAQSDVTFDEISDDIIAAYVVTGEPLDKAGAYGIQGKALSFIPGIRGDYFNVVGFPIELVKKQLQPYYPDLSPAPMQPTFPAENYGDFSWVR